MRACKTRARYAGAGLHEVGSVPELFHLPNPANLAKGLTNQPGTLWSWTSRATQFPDGPPYMLPTPPAESRLPIPKLTFCFFLEFLRAFRSLRSARITCEICCFLFPPCQWDKMEETLGDKPTEEDTTSQTIRKTTSETRPKTNSMKRTRLPRPDGRQVARHHRKQGGQKTGPKDCGHSIPHQRQEKTADKTGNRVGLQTRTNPYSGEKWWPRLAQCQLPQDHSSTAGLKHRT